MKKYLLWPALLLLGLGGRSPAVTIARAEKIPALVPIPDELSASQHSILAQRQQALSAELARFQTAAAAFNAKSAENQSDSEYNAVQAQRDHYVAAARAYNGDLAAALQAARTIRGMNALAQKLGWSVAQRARLARALDKLGFDGDPEVTSDQISQTWSDVLARGTSGDLEREAAQGLGVGFPGAGTQTVDQDCAIFALANAADLPYGAVAARASKLIHEGDWHPPAERDDPQKVIEKHGLNGGEVVMLAEAFGQAEVVPSRDFARVIREGRPVLVNVVPPSGQVNSGHEVVLTRAFQHGGETWFAMMDSNQGPDRRLYLSSRELNTMLQENGVAYRPEPGSTPRLLR